MQENATGRFQIYNTNLSELGTMAYEYGYSMENPKNLCLWEAQFGDFANTAAALNEASREHGASPGIKWPLCG